MVLGQAFDAPYGSELVVEAHASNENSSRRLAKLLYRVAGRFNALIHCLEEHALLGIHGLSFFRVNGEEVAIKGTGVLIEKIGMLDVRTLFPKRSIYERKFDSYLCKCWERGLLLHGAGYLGGGMPWY